MENGTPNLSLKQGILKNMNLGENKSSNVSTRDEERNTRTQAKDEHLRNSMMKKYNDELKYTKQKKKILRNNHLSVKEKQVKLRNLSKKTLRRNSFYHRSGYNMIGKSLKRGINENRLGQKESITNEINECKTKILQLKYKLLYGFLDETEIEREFEIQLETYKKLLKKRQNIDFLVTKKQEESVRELNMENDKLKVFIQKYSALMLEDKEEAVKFYIEEIIPQKETLFQLQNKDLEVIQHPDNERIHYLYKK